MKKTLAERRSAEIDKYISAYGNPRYGMGEKRKEDVQKLLISFPSRGSLFDFGTGRGETLNFAACLGYFPVVGAEVVPDLFSIKRENWIESWEDLSRFRFREGPPPVLECAVEDLIFIGNESFDHVTCFDVLEHLLEEDIVPCLMELGRIARRSVTVSAADFSHIHDRVELHISKRPKEAWFKLLQGCFPSISEVGKIGPSDGFQVIL